MYFSICLALQYPGYNQQSHEGYCHGYRGLAYLALENRIKTISSLEAAIVYLPGNTIFIKNLAQLYNDYSGFTKALCLYQNLCFLEPENIYFYEHQSHCFKKILETTADYNKAIWVVKYRNFLENMSVNCSQKKWLRDDIRWLNLFENKKEHSASPNFSSYVMPSFSADVKKGSSTKMVTRKMHSKQNDGEYRYREIVSNWQW